MANNLEIGLTKALHKAIEMALAAWDGDDGRLCPSDDEIEAVRTAMLDARSIGRMDPKLDAALADLFIEWDDEWESRLHITESAIEDVRRATKAIINSLPSDDPRRLGVDHWPEDPT